MNPPHVLSCIIITILAIAELTWQKSVLDTSKEDALQYDRHPRAIKNDPLVFPKNSPLTNPTPCPDGQIFCDGVNDYPAAKINDLLKKQRPSTLFLGHFFVEEDDDDVNKFGPDSGDPLCVSSSQVIFPQKGRSREGTFEFIVNNNEHKQGIRVESCISRANGGGCRIPGTLSYGYTSNCVQKFVHRTLVVLNTNSSSGEGFVTKPFELPSCCSCEIFSSSNRFGDANLRSPVRPTPVRSKSSGDIKNT